MSFVVETVVPVTTCGRCGAPSSPGQRFCTECGVLLGRAAATTPYEVLRDVTVATPGTVVLARLVDVLVCLLGGAVGAVLLAAAHAAVSPAGPLASLVVGAVCGVVVTTLVVVGRASRTGRGPGGLLLRTRVVDTDDALPAGPLLQLVRLRRGPHDRRASAGPWARATGTVTASLRHGRDPLTPSSPPLGTAFGAAPAAGVRPGSGPAPDDLLRTGGPSPAPHDTTRRAGADAGRAPAPSAHVAGAGTAPRSTPVPSTPVLPAPPLAPAEPAPDDAVVLRFDSGAVHWFHGTCVVGRNPEAEPGVATVAVPDLSRTLSKTHVALVQADGHVLVRDLGSTNGTSVVRADSSFEDLVPGVDLTVAAGATVRIGDHAFVVTATGSGS